MGTTLHESAAQIKRVIRSSRWDKPLLKQPCRTQDSFTLMKLSCQDATCYFVQHLWSHESKNTTHRGSRKAAGKQVQTGPRAKKPKEKQSNSSPLPTHTDSDECSGTPPSKPLRQWGGEEGKGGRKLSLRSWHSTWLVASLSLPASQTLLSWWAMTAGGCSTEAALKSLSAFPARTWQSQEAVTELRHIPKKQKR